MHEKTQMDNTKIRCAWCGNNFSIPADTPTETIEMTFGEWFSSCYPRGGNRDQLEDCWNAAFEEGKRLRPGSRKGGEMTYEEFEDRQGARTTDNRRAVWDAAFEEGTRHAWEELAQLEAELAECRTNYDVALTAWTECQKELAECRRKLGQNPPEKRSPDPSLKQAEKLSTSSST